MSSWRIVVKILQQRMVLVELESVAESTCRKPFRDQHTECRERSNVIGVAANFEGFDFTSFWRDDAYARKAYISPAPSDALIASTEDELGYKLPAAYVALMKLHNGGVPHHRCFPAEGPTGWAEDHVALTGFSGSVATRTVRSLADWAASS